MCCSVHCIVLQLQCVEECVAVCCSMYTTRNGKLKVEKSQCVVVCVALFCSVLQLQCVVVCVAVCCSVLQNVYYKQSSVHCIVLQLQCVVECVVVCVAVCCSSVLQCVAVCILQATAS